MRNSEFLYPGNIARCQHIKVNGIQCGCPALKSRSYCYFHYECHQAGLTPTRGRRRGSDFLLNAPLEDANSIQLALMRVMHLIYSGKLDQKRASLLLYALQTASANLARTTFDVARPTKVVVDKNRVAETPLGMTPWSENGNDHEIEDDEQNLIDEEESRERFRHLALELTESLQPKTEEEWQKREDLVVLAGFYSYQSYLDHRQKEKEYEQTEAYDAELHAKMRERRLQADLGEKETGLDIQACVSSQYPQTSTQ